MQTAHDYKYVRAHFPNNMSWYRELVYLDDTLVGEIQEPVTSTSRNKLYNVRKYIPMQVVDGEVSITSTIKTFNTVSDCKDFINNGGLQ